MFTRCRLCDALGLVSALLLLTPGGLAHAQSDELCLECHEPPEGLSDSIHGELGLGCVDCHQDLMGVEDLHEDTPGPPDCSMCHDDAQAEFETGVHGYALDRGNPRAPTCVTCHGSHDILATSDPRSVTHRSNLAGTCARCHGEAGLLTDHWVKLPDSVTAFAKSVHGVHAAAICTDCHGSHGLRGASDPRSLINRLNLSTTCGTCHDEAAAEYDASIHGRALQAGVSDSPTCTDCHGEHLILSPLDREAGTYASRLALETCGACHNDPVIIAKYSLRGGVVGSYVDSYHGWATRRDYDRAATCVRCHGAHLVLPKADPESTIHPDNVVAMCRHCHKTADMAFAASYTHESVSITANPINRWIRVVYLSLITLVIGGMVVHNVVIMNYFVVQRRRAVAETRWLLRLDRLQRFQHLLLVVSFTVLVVTGFALRYPEAWWVRLLAVAGMSEPVRGDLHRIFAGVMLVVGIIHVLYIGIARRGRGEFQAMLPRMRDARDLVDNLRFHTWLGERRAAFGRYDYTQKAEYWAVIWGTVLMAATGLVLWFPEAAVKVFPSWIVSASQTIHFYEAWLATLAILVWHFFFVIFHPAHYPMSWTWLTGKMPLDEVKEHHPEWYAEEIDRPELPKKNGASSKDSS